MMKILVLLGCLFVCTECGVQCPDPTMQCPDGMTCCAQEQGGYGCCPMPQAVCCSDKVHCCPHGTVCHVSTSQCTKQNGDAVPWNVKLPAESTVEDTLCPDQQTSCLGDQTCCQLQDGSYGCCPHKHAVCCSDHLHCCPQNSRCDLQHETCVFSNADDSKYSVFWHKIHRIMQNDEQAVDDLVTCPDGAKCPAGSTCCAAHIFDNHYSCCPLKNGVCCTNHCCPQGFTCSGNSCYQVATAHHTGAED